LSHDIVGLPSIRSRTGGRSQKVALIMSPHKRSQANNIAAHLVAYHLVRIAGQRCMRPVNVKHFCTLIMRKSAMQNAILLFLKHTEGKEQFHFEWRQ